MSFNIQPASTGSRGYTNVTTTQRNKVLRNTYWLLCLTLVPTVVGAWFGVATSFGQMLTQGWSNLVLFLAAMGLIFAVQRTKDSAAGVGVLLGFTFVMGLLMSNLLRHTLGFSNGADLIMIAFAGTAGVFFTMATLSTVIKRDLSGMSQWLFIGLCVVVVGSLINLFVGSTAGMLAISVASIGLFSAYMLYDLKQIVDGGETNYITATLSLYLDIVNVFTALLRLLGIFGGED